MRSAKKWGLHWDLTFDKKIDKFLVVPLKPEILYSYFAFHYLAVKIFVIRSKLTDFHEWFSIIFFNLTKLFKTPTPTLEAFGGCGVMNAHPSQQHAGLQKHHPILHSCKNWNKIAPWFRLRLPSCGPGFESQAHHLRFFQFVLLKLYRENNENNENKQKEAGTGPFLKKELK